jgi:hypothetical protein
MRLLRVQVPEFRALKDVDISFEPEFNPQVFPLGSLNGGGKSTLLQLIFVLLNINVDFDKPSNLHPSCFREQLFSLIEKSAEKNTLSSFATISLLDDDGIKITLNYAHGNIANADSYLKDLNHSYFLYSFSPFGNTDRGFCCFVSIEGDNGEPTDYREILDNRYNAINNITKVSELVFLSQGIDI